LIKTAAGKFVPPQPIENALKTSPYILNAMVVGDKRKFIVALIVPNPATVGAQSRRPGNQVRLQRRTGRPSLGARVNRFRSQASHHPSRAVRNHQRFALLPEDFTFDNGSLTFTLKLKRRVVEQQYAAVIESLYADVAEPRPILQD